MVDVNSGSCKAKSSFGNVASIFELDNVCSIL